MSSNVSVVAVGAARGRQGDVQVRGGPVLTEQQVARIHGLEQGHHGRYQVHATHIGQPHLQVLREVLVSFLCRFPWPMLRACP